MKNIIVNVPANTIPHKMGERYMICEYDGEIKRCVEFFKTWDDVLEYPGIEECENYINKTFVVAV